MISIIFEMGEEPNIFRDAIVLPVDHTLSDDDIESIKQSRYASWLKSITTNELE